MTPNVGDVFTIGVLGAGVHEVNPVTKARLPFLKQFRVVSGTPRTHWVISPALIWNGAFQNGESVGQTDLNSLALTCVGTAATVYPQNMLFHRNAFALGVVCRWRSLLVRLMWHGRPTRASRPRDPVLRRLE